MSKRDLKVVVGLGATGLSCVHYLSSKGYEVAVVDSRQEPPGLQDIKANYPQVQVELGSFNHPLLNEASELIVSPGISVKEPAIVAQAERGIPIIGDIELFAQHANKPVVAITGSNGKSTVTSLVGLLAERLGKKVKVGGNLGVPALELLADGDTELFVLELSSFQLETTYTLKTLSSVNLNISPDHMDRYDSLSDYINAKLRVYQHCQHPIINLDDPQSYQSYPFDKQPIGFTLQEPTENSYGLRNINGETFLAYGNHNLLSTKALAIKGQHQYANVLAALALGSAIGLPLAEMPKYLGEFTGLPHRCQWVAKINGVDWYNDSKATNVGSAQAAIVGIGPEIEGRLILLAGGQGKNADFSELFAPIKQYVKKLILFGEDRFVLARTLAGAAPIAITDDLEAAIQLAKKAASEGDVVILSPACASFDMFKNFEHRGDVFIELVRGLA